MRKTAVISLIHQKKIKSVFADRRFVCTAIWSGHCWSTTSLHTIKVCFLLQVVTCLAGLHPELCQAKAK